MNLYLFYGCFKFLEPIAKCDLVCQEKIIHNVNSFKYILYYKDGEGASSPRGQGTRRVIAESEQRQQSSDG
jgi:hypothetical protein